MGCHIHLSCLLNSEDDYEVNLLDDDNENHKFTFKGTQVPIKILMLAKKLNRINNAILQKVKIEMPEIAEQFEQHYYRRYARKFNVKPTRIRSSSINMTLAGFEHIEFRSFHLLGIDTWEKFHKIFGLVAEVLYDQFNMEFNRKKPFIDSMGKGIKI